MLRSVAVRGIEREVGRMLGAIEKRPLAIAAPLLVAARARFRQASLELPPEVWLLSVRFT